MTLVDRNTQRPQGGSLISGYASALIAWSSTSAQAPVNLRALFRRLLVSSDWSPIAHSLAQRDDVYQLL
jgi:hypothetical protein